MNFARVFIALFAAAVITALGACSGAGDRSASEQTSLETTSEDTFSGEEEMLEVRQIDSGSPGQGGAEPRAVVASSLGSLSESLGGDLRSAENTAGNVGAGAYVAVFWGEKSTGGYAVEVESARLEEDRVVVELSLRGPPEGAIVAQAFTYPYAVAMVEGPSLSNKEFVLVDQNGNELNWPVQIEGG